MSLCLEHAWRYQTLTLPNPAVAAMVVDEAGRILSLCAHKIAGGPHAEVLALKEAYAKLSGNEDILKLQDSAEIHEYLQKHHRGVFRSCSLYVTLEPCNNEGKTPPCARLLAQIKPKAVYISAPEYKNTGGTSVLEKEGIRAVGEILKHRGEDLLLPFLSLQRKDRFILFKLAMRLDGDYKSGLISCDLAREFSHNQRTRARSIVISKNTLLSDNPKLDCRFACAPYKDSALPDVGIISRDDLDLDPSLEVFLEKSRRIKKFELEDGFHIIEGGWSLLESLLDCVDMLLIHVSPSLLNSQFCGASFSKKFKILHSQKIGDDILLWLANF